MKTLTADDRSRVQIPTAKPGQVFAYEVNHGTVTLTPIETEEVKEPFPPASLVQYVDEWNKEFGPIAEKMKIPPPPEEWD